MVISVTDISILLLVFIWIIIIFLGYRKKKIVVEKKKIINEAKKNKAVKILNKRVRKIDEIRDFVYSIKELYYYNPPAFSEMIDNIHLFFKFKDNAYLDNSRAGVNLEKMIKRKSGSINALSSIIYTIDTHPLLVNKLDLAVRSLEFILLPHLDEVYELYKKYIEIDGFDNQTKIFDFGPKAPNEYDIDPDKGNITDKFSYAII